jgi:nitronate monooxygenase
MTIDRRPASLMQRLGITLPILQAPMAGAQGSALAIAVCEAGGLGGLPCAMLTAETMRSEAQAIRAATARPFNVNFFCHTPPAADAARDAAWRTTLAPYYAEFGLAADTPAGGAARHPFGEAAVDVLDEIRPPVVSFHFGLPEASLLARVKRFGAIVLSSATTVDEARWLEAHGADVIVAQGLEAGGHRGHFLSGDLARQMGTFALLPQVLDAVRVPVVAAGGIADARGVAAALALGASAVQVGTAYLLCPEAATSKVHRAALKSAEVRHTALTNLFTGRPARGVVNRVMRELGALNAAAPEFPLAGAAMAPLRSAAEAAGSGDFSPLWSGQNATGCREAGAALITRELAGAYAH